MSDQYQLVDLNSLMQAAQRKTREPFAMHVVGIQNGYIVRPVNGELDTITYAANLEEVKIALADARAHYDMTGPGVVQFVPRGDA